MSSSSPRSATACKVGSGRMESPRFAASMTQPMGIGEQVGRDRPLPADLGSVGGVGAGPFTRRTRLCAGWASTATSDRSRGDDLVVAGDGFFDELVEHPGGEPFGAPGAQGGLTCPTEPGCDVPAAAGGRAERGSLGSSPGPGCAAGGSPVGACRGAVVVGVLGWPSRQLRRHGGPWRARRPAVDSLKRQNPKYCYFEHSYFKPGGVGCQAKPLAVSGPRLSNAAEPRSTPRSRPWACRYPAAWSSGGPAAATLAATATATRRSCTGPT